MTVRERVEREAEELAEVRDDLKVRLHLAKMDAQDLWQQLEKRWQHAESKLKVLAEASKETAEDVGEATQLVISELKQGYDKLRRML